MKSIIFTSAITLLIFLPSCTKTNTKTVTVTVTDTVTHTIIDTLNDVHLANGLVAYYPFNGNANDTSGNGLNGTITGGVGFSNDAAGNANSAATFDGSTGYIIVPDITGKFQTSALSISFLVNLTNTTVRESFIANQNFTDGTGLTYGVVIGTAGTSLPYFGVPTNTLGCGAPIYDLSSTVSIANQMNPNKWYNIVAIFSDSLQEIFVNGILNTAITRNFGTLNHCSSNNSLMIGAWWSGDLIPVNGSMDEVRIYNRALNQDEINQLAKAVQ
ncbi:MAG TPA: LamG domain-containing protein [Puia sp.]|nr:LamG domain-containing protein [Puia sp.]